MEEFCKSQLRFDPAKADVELKILNTLLCDASELHF